MSDTKSPIKDFIGTPQCDGSVFTNATPPPSTITITTGWGPGRTLIYPWQIDKSPIPPPYTTFKK